MYVTSYLLAGRAGAVLDASRNVIYTGIHASLLDTLCLCIIPLKWGGCWAHGKECHHHQRYRWQWAVIVTTLQWGEDEQFIADALRIYIYRTTTMPMRLLTLVLWYVEYSGASAGYTGERCLHFPTSRNNLASSQSPIWSHNNLPSQSHNLQSCNNLISKQSYKTLISILG